MGRYSPTGDPNKAVVLAGAIVRENVDDVTTTRVVRTMMAETPGNRRDDAKGTISYVE